MKSKIVPLFGFKKEDTEKEQANLNETPTISDEELEQTMNLQDILEFVETTLQTSFKHLKNVDISLDANLAELTNGDIVRTSHALMSVHEVTNVKMDYLPLTEYETFPTVRDVVQYFLDRYDYRINIENPQQIEKEE